MTDDYAAQLARVIDRYDIGELITCLRDERGTVNTSFTIQTMQGGERRTYFFRRYKRGVKEEELLFEHSVLQRLAKQGLDLVAQVLTTRDGKTFVTQPAEDGGAPVYFAIFTFLEGEDKYTWVAPRCTPGEIKSSAQLLADFHRSIAGWTPRGNRVEPKIMELLPLIDENVVRLQNKPIGRIFDEYLAGNLSQIRREIEDVLNALRSAELVSLPQQVVHSDYHPGNLKFRDEQVVGLFDFDWSKIDYRLFDVALALFYFFTEWRGEADGALRLEDTALFLKAYQRALTNRTGQTPLSELELCWLPWMLRASNIYVLNWGILDCLNKEVDPEEYLVYLKHAVCTLAWFREAINWSDLATLVKSMAIYPQAVGGVSAQR